MSVRLESVGLTVNGVDYIYDANIIFRQGSMNTLLGATLSGKTSLMRLMAGLDKPTKGRIYEWDVDVTNIPVQQRNVAMVYQSFINYPAMTVYENIASPLRLLNLDSSTMDSRIKQIADLVHLTPYLQRMPLELSGGQQQRCALARALVKQSGLVLLDEPLANLDYKLREELRSEMHNIFANSKAIFIYATTEPEEALLLGGNTATLYQGNITQFDTTRNVYHYPQCKITASVFSNPPMNMAQLHKQGDTITISGVALSPINARKFQYLDDGTYELGFRGNHLYNNRQHVDNVAFETTLSVCEITGSATFLHVSHQHIHHNTDHNTDHNTSWVVLLDGIHHLPLGAKVWVYLDLKYAYVFAQNGNLVQSADYMQKQA